MKTALLLIDIQDDYFPGGRMALEGAEEAAAQAKKLLDYFRAGSVVELSSRQHRPCRSYEASTPPLPLVHIQHIATDPGATFFLPGTPGAQIHAPLQPLPGETVIVKHNVNAFLDTPLLEHLRSLAIERLVICGSMTHMCVDAAVRASADLGFQVLVAADACATRALTHAGLTVPADHVHAAFLASFRAYAKVKTTEEILAEVQM